MSSFVCPECGKAIIDTERGYITGCKHYPRNETVVASGRVNEHGYLDGIFCPIGIKGTGKIGKLVFRETKKGE